MAGKYIVFCSPLSGKILRRSMCHGILNERLRIGMTPEVYIEMSGFQLSSLNEVARLSVNRPIVKVNKRERIDIGVEILR
jgi:hypothetical protein